MRDKEKVKRGTDSKVRVGMKGLVEDRRSQGNVRKKRHIRKKRNSRKKE